MLGGQPARRQRARIAAAARGQPRIMAAKPGCLSAAALVAVIGERDCRSRVSGGLAEVPI
jgi:hypothetical protein